VTTPPDDAADVGATAQAAPDATSRAHEGWARLDPRMLVVAPAQELVKFVPLFAVALIAGGSGNRQWWVLGALVGVVAVGMLRWLTTRYRITAERIELRSGLLFRQHRSVPRDRVRTVDVTARPLHRAFGLTVLRVGTGQHEPGRDGELTLDAVSSQESERLRATLLDRGGRAVTVDPTTPAGAPGGAPGGVGGDASGGPGRTGVELAAISWAWLRFAPLTLLGVGAIGALFGGAWQVLGEAGVDLEDVGLARGAVDWVTERPLLPAIAVLVATLLVAGSVGAVALYVEAWWGYRLTREPDGTLRVNRGLLTRRSVSLEERRLRGAEVLEPLLLRAGRGARCAAVATGSGSGDRASVLPPAPHAEAVRVASAILGEPPPGAARVGRSGAEPAQVPPLGVTLVRHPRAAMRRRLVRAVAPALAVVAALGAGTAWGPLPDWPWVTAAVVLLPAAVLLGVDRYRSLGHVLLDEYLVVRAGSLLRRTVVLRRQGIIGWQVSQSVFQRSAGLATATAVTAAGAGAYPLLDVEVEHAMTLGERVLAGSPVDTNDSGPSVTIQ
jgi:putative membrane protein